MRGWAGVGGSGWGHGSGAGAGWRSRLTSSRLSVGSSLPPSSGAASSTPATSVRRSSARALSAAAIAPDIVSALTLYDMPSLPMATGAMTGTCAARPGRLGGRRRGGGLGRGRSADEPRLAKALGGPGRDLARPRRGASELGGGSRPLRPHGERLRRGGARCRCRGGDTYNMRGVRCRCRGGSRAAARARRRARPPGRGSPRCRPPPRASCAPPSPSCRPCLMR